MSSKLFFPESFLNEISRNLFRLPDLAKHIREEGELLNDVWVIPRDRFDSLMAQAKLRAADETRPAYPRAPKPGFVPQEVPPPSAGPGTELKKLLKRVGITATPNCSCNARARRMDEEEAKEPGWCEAHLDEIVGWLREEATKRGLPFLDAAGRVLVKRAISNARKAEARRATEAQGEDAAV